MPLSSSTLSGTETAAPPRAEDALAQAARQDFQFLWRSLRRLGVRPDAAVDDAVQQVFEVAARKRERIEPGRERAFLFKTALLVAAQVRRAQRRSAARLAPDAIEPVSPSPDPEQQLSTEQRRALLDQVLEAMSFDTRTVFVLFELEGMSTTDIASLLALAPGTVASRLRRGREQFHAEARRLRARDRFEGEVR